MENTEKIKYDSKTILASEVNFFGQTPSKAAFLVNVDVFLSFVPPEKLIFRNMGSSHGERKVD